MRLISSLLTCAVVLAGCSNGYAIDHVRPKMFLLGPQLTRYGLDASQSQCVGERLGGSLTVWQMRQLSDVARALPTGGNYPAQLTIRDLLWVSALVEDPRVAIEVARAAESCGAGVERSAASAVTGAIPAPPETIDAVAPPPLEPEPLPDPTVVDPEPAVPPPVDTPVTDSGLSQEQLLAIFNRRASPPASATPQGPTIVPKSNDARAAIDAYIRGDFAAAAPLLKAAAEQGDRDAQNYLGQLYLTGKGVRRDPAEAVKWFTMAADSGDVDAMNSLGQAYETGQGVPRDTVNALKWYLLALGRSPDGEGESAYAVQNLSGDMTLEQITDAGELVREWKRAHPQ